MQIGVRSNSVLSLVLVILWMTGTAVRGLEPRTVLDRTGRQSWTTENGLPENTVPVLLQSREGYLWVGTETGLARFDGVSFRVFDHANTPSLPEAEIRCLMEGSAGELWIGTSEGLVRFREGRGEVSRSADGAAGNSIRGLARTADGVVWAWTDSGLAQWKNGRLVAEGLPAGLRTVTSIAGDGKGALWVGFANGWGVLKKTGWGLVSDSVSQGRLSGTAAKDMSKSSPVQGVFTLVRGSDEERHGNQVQMLVANASGTYEAVAGGFRQLLRAEQMPGDGLAFLSQSGTGQVAVASRNAVVISPEKSGAGMGGATRFQVGAELPGTRIQSLYADREDCVWIGTNRGMARAAGGGRMERVAASDPLAKGSVMTLLEDREGDMWAGTETGGLHILRDARFETISAADGLNSDATTAVVETRDGVIWVGTRDAGLNRLGSKAATQKSSSIGRKETGNEWSSVTTRDGLPSNVILSLARGGSGDLWVGTADGLMQIDRGTKRTFTSADGLPDDFIRSILTACDGSLWVGTRRGLTHYEQGRFRYLTERDGLGSDLVGALAQGKDGDLWVATLKGLTRIHLGILENFTTANGLVSNVITALEVTQDGQVWIGSQGDGLSVWTGSRFVGIGDRGGIPRAIHAIAEDGAGGLWITSNNGLTRVSLDSLDGCVRTGKCEPKTAHFTTADGLRSRETSSNSHPTAMRSQDGKLWLTTPRGLIVLDPRNFARSAPAPPVVIERMMADDEEGSAGAKISAGHLRFQFDYAGLSFASPQKLRYQYMLENFDHGWTDAGTRRTAYYTNIPPGRYLFRVRATLGDDFAGPDLEKEAASFAFELRPHFYQTAWFVVLVLLVIAGMVWLIYRRRVLRVERELGAVMAERNRIAREIHDTLAQGYVGISIQLEILGQLLHHDRAGAAANHLALTQEQVRDGLNDARQSIWALRSQDAGEKTLPIRLRRLVEQARDGQLAAELKVHGAYRPLAPETEQEILRIAQESIQNTKRHAGAGHLRVELNYEEKALTMTVQDDGRGFREPAANEAANGAGGMAHYGLTGMRERAGLIRARLEISSQIGEGTIVKLSVPMAAALRNAQ